MPITTCANLLWLTTHLRRRSMILNATASGAAASVYMSIGTMGRRRNTLAISARRTASNFSRSAEAKVIKPLKTLRKRVKDDLARHCIFRLLPLIKARELPHVLVIARVGADFTVRLHPYRLASAAGLDSF